MAKTVYRMSPIGLVKHPWLNRPDTKYNPVYSGDLIASGKPAEDFAAQLDREAQEAFDELSADMTPGERKKHKVYVPYERLEDSDGNPTGEIMFSFKQNATIKLKDGTSKDVKITLQDSEGNDMLDEIYSGSRIRFYYATRAIKVAATRQLGVKLDFAGVQVAELVTGGSQGRRFEKIEGGYVAPKKAKVDDEEGSDDGAPQDTGGDF